jgi:hypothetical protein
MSDKSVPASPDSRDGWFTSSYTNGGGSCVEVKFGRDAILLRDSKDRRADRPIIAVGSAAWRTFLDAVTSD